MAVQRASKGSTSPLQVAVARLLGYRWPRQTGSSFPDCPGLKPDGLEKFADEDGIVCLNAIKGEQPAAERLRALLAAAFGREWSAAQQAELLAQADYAGATLEDWLRNGFFEQHCQMFHQRPFIWQVWDGLRDGFSALVNYHQLDHPTLEKLTYTYLGDWIARQKPPSPPVRKAVMPNSPPPRNSKPPSKRSSKASRLRHLRPLETAGETAGRLESRPQRRCSPEHPPFVEAHILRKNPKVNWNKDRGKDVASAPWFPKFKGERINDYHLTLAEKQKARR